MKWTETIYFTHTELKFSVMIAENHSHASSNRALEIMLLFKIEHCYCQGVTKKRLFSTEDDLGLKLCHKRKRVICIPLNIVRF